MSAGTELEQQIAYLADHLFADHPLNRPGYSLAFRESLLTGNGMLEIIEAMQGRGFYMRLDSWQPDTHGGPGFTASFDMGRDEGEVAESNSAAEAVALAAYEALTTRDRG